MKIRQFLLRRWWVQNLCTSRRSRPYRERLLSPYKLTKIWKENYRLPLHWISEIYLKISGYYENRGKSSNRCLLRQRNLNRFEFVKKWNQHSIFTRNFFCLRKLLAKSKILRKINPTASSWDFLQVEVRKRLIRYPVFYFIFWMAL